MDQKKIALIILIVVAVVIMIYIVHVMVVKKAAGNGGKVFVYGTFIVKTDQKVQTTNITVMAQISASTSTIWKRHHWS